MTRYENRMVIMLQNLAIEEQQGVIQFLIAEGVKLAAIYRRLVTIQG